MFPLRTNVQFEPVPSPDISPEARLFINHLRLAAMECRTKPKANLFEACALLQTTRSASREVYADALMRCLNDALGKPARLLMPGSKEMTFDENWLLQLGTACARGDWASDRFLLNSRVSLENRRLVRFLISHIAACFSLN